MERRRLVQLHWPDYYPRKKAQAKDPGLQGFPNFPAKAKRVIYLFQSGAPSQMDLFDPKPGMEKGAW
jgi:hypothetical protein